MAVRFLKSTAATTPNRTLRPSGYTFPTGLNQTVAAANASFAGPTSVDYLVIAGGGSGSSPYGGGGGGAGGFLSGSGFSVTQGTEYTITVGAGGAQTNGPSEGNAGSNSSFSTVLAYGGGKGDSGNGTGNGGSGGGLRGAGQSTTGGGIGVYPGSTYVSAARQGYDGGTSTPNSNPPMYCGGGGGGAGGVGQNGSPQGTVGNGGAGASSPISGTSVTYAGGGGGGGGRRLVDYPGARSSGGSGGGGAGGNQNVATANGSDGLINTGSGGGGGGSYPLSLGVEIAGSGGSGIVIIRYTGSQNASGGTITTSPGYTIHTFTGPGIFKSNTQANATSAVYNIN
jgi:hypothetical protein